MTIYPIYQYRVVVGDNDTSDKEYSDPIGTEEAALADLALRMAPEYAEPPYEIGWVERRLIDRWTMVGRPTTGTPAAEAA